MDYKADITLNEKDSLLDILIAEKALLKLYATAISEGTTKEFRKTVKDNLDGAIVDQINAFFCITENDYARVEACDRERLSNIKESFIKAKTELA